MDAYQHCQAGCNISFCFHYVFPLLLKARSSAAACWRCREEACLIIDRHDYLRDVVPELVASGSGVIFRDGCSHIDTDVEGFGHGKQAGLGPSNLAFANLFLGR